jgi:PRTRC genetic system protein A
MFVCHIHALEGQELPPFGNYLMEYITAANGVFVRAKRPGLEALQPVCWNPGPAIRGLAEVQPYVRVEYPIPSLAIGWALDCAYQAMPHEVLVWINWQSGKGGWRAYRPAQTTTAVMCKPHDPSNPLGHEAVVDIHSHNSMPAFFSRTDDQDEKAGFRLYAVVGRLDTEPEILVRVGIFGHFSVISASSVMDLPLGLHDVSQGLEDLAVGFPEGFADEVREEAGDGLQP